MNWHLPFEQRSSDDRALEEMPRYQFVTNFYQGFGLSFIAVLSQDVPSEMTDQERARIDALNQQFLGQQQQVGNLLLPQYQSILNNPGLSAADKAAATGQSQRRSIERLRFAAAIRAESPRAHAQLRRLR